MEEDADKTSSGRHQEGLIFKNLIILNFFGFRLIMVIVGEQFAARCAVLDNTTGSAAKMDCTAPSVKNTAPLPTSSTYSGNAAT